MHHVLAFVSGIGSHQCSGPQALSQPLAGAQFACRMQLSYAVLLAGGFGKNLHPLTSAGTPKALLPVGNQALISFPLKTLEQGGVTHTIVVSRMFLSSLELLAKGRAILEVLS